MRAWRCSGTFRGRIPEAFGICPVAERGARRPAGRRSRRRSTRRRTATISWRRSIARWSRRSTGNDSRSRRNGHLTHVRPFPISVDLPDTPPPSGSEEVATRAARGAPGRTAGGVQLPGRRRGSHRLHQGHHRALSRHRAVPGTVARLPGALHVRPDRRAEPHADPALPRAGRGDRRRGGAHQPAVRDRHLAAHRAAEPASRPRGDRAVLPRGRSLPGDVAPRRHEPGRQGVRRGARGRRWRADAEPVCRRQRGTARRAHRESVRHRRTGRRRSTAPSSCPRPSARRGWAACARIVREHNIYRWAGT